jgi:DNA-binding transcriptional MerR regulator
MYSFCYGVIMPVGAYMRIGELSRRTGVSPELLRAWERRYGLVRPERSQGGFRLYSESDQGRVRAMRALVDRGLSAAEAARLVLAEDLDAPADETIPLDVSGALLEAVLAFDDVGANAVLDRLFASFGVETVLRDAVFPVLRELGERWERGESSIAQEHFASNLLRGRLLGLARGWDRGVGPRAILACPGGELHDVGLVVFGLALRSYGWRITYLGADTPIETVHDAVVRLEPDVVVVAAASQERLAPAAEALSDLARSVTLALAGLGATAEMGIRTGALLLREDPFSAAERVASLPRRG